MFRRRRPPIREPLFSFDSFMDIVANVIGIVVRLILVTWVGARAYSSIRPIEVLPPPPEPEMPLVSDPLENELVRMRSELAQSQNRLLEQARRLGDVRKNKDELKGRVMLTSLDRQKLEDQRKAWDQSAGEQGKKVAVTTASLNELRQRSKQMVEQLDQLQKQPTTKKALRYRTPVSQPVNSEEQMFECKMGRVSFVDLSGFLYEIKGGVEEKVQGLKSQWRVENVTRPIGAFRLRYGIERERGVLDQALDGGLPGASGGFRYGLSDWEVEPIAALRGETVERALAPGSDFRHIADGLDPQANVVTFWVYPDSFELYRRLRDYLHEKDVEVAGRPLPEGIPIRASRKGTASRGQ